MKVMAFDTETTGLERYRQDVMFAYSTCTYDGETEVVRIDGKGGLSRRQGLSRLDEFWTRAERGEYAVVMHNAKFDTGFAEKALGRKLAEKVDLHDTVILSNIHRNDHNSHGLKPLAWELFGISMDDEKKVKAYIKGQGGNYSHVPPEIMGEYQDQDAQRCMLLFRAFWKEIEDNPALLLNYAEEMQLIRDTMRMEERGLRLNLDRCHQRINELERDAENVLDEAEQIVGRRLNLGNNNIIRKLLFEELQLPILSKSPTGQASTDKETLFQLREHHPHPVLELVLKYRAWLHGVASFREYLSYVDDMGFIHPSIHTCGAKTGRESCRQPNLQNVEKAGNEAALLNPFPVGAREAFIPRDKHVFFFIDYAGQEIRIALHYAPERELVNALERGEDLHWPAAKVFYPPWSEREIELYGAHVDPWIIAGIEAAGPEHRKSMRNATKNGNFATIYGANEIKLGQTLGLPGPIMKTRYRRYKETFPRFSEYMKTVSEFARKHGHIDTAFGRRLYIPRMKGYIAANHLIQGTASSMIKRAQIKVQEYLRQKTGGAASVLLPIHDEIIIEWPRRLLYKAPLMFREIKERMTDLPELSVPMDIEVKISTTNWAEKHDYKYLELTKGA